MLAAHIIIVVFNFIKGSDMIQIKEKKGYRGLKEFAKFPEILYKDCEQWVPDLISDEITNFTPKNNPLFEYCDARCFMAYRDGKPVGRIAGIISRKANEKWGTKRIRISRFDFIDDLEVSKALINAVEEWGRAEGLEEIHGPIGFCDLDQEGMLIEGFEYQSLFFTIYNYPYYVKHMEALGFEKDVDWVEYRVKVPDKVDERIKKLSELVMKRSKLRVFKAKKKRELYKYIMPLFEVLNEAYSKLYGVVPLTEAMINKYKNQFIMLINIEYVRLILDENDRLVGFGFAIPSLSEASKVSRGRLFPFGWLRLLMATKKKNTVLDLYLLGVIPEMQNKGLTALLMNEITEVAIKNRMTYAETGPELETNDKVQALWKGYDAIQHKRRRCWIKKIEAK